MPLIVLIIVKCICLIQQQKIPSLCDSRRRSQVAVSSIVRLLCAVLFYLSMLLLVVLFSHSPFYYSQIQEPSWGFISVQAKPRAGGT